MADFGTLKVNQVIMHRVPKGTAAHGAPDAIDYSEAPIELSAVDKGFIQLRLRSALAGRARSRDRGPRCWLRRSGPGSHFVAVGTGDLVADSAALARGSTNDRSG